MANKREGWRIEPSWPGLFSVYDEDGNPVVQNTTKDRAYLIAAAPELLEALAAALWVLEDRLDVLKRLAVKDTPAQPGILRVAGEVRQVLEQARAAIGKAKGKEASG